MEDMNKNLNLAGHEAELDMFVVFLEGLRDQKNSEKEKAENHLKVSFPLSPSFHPSHLSPSFPPTTSNRSLNKI